MWKPQEFVGSWGLRPQTPGYVLSPFGQILGTPLHLGAPISWTAPGGRTSSYATATSHDGSFVCEATTIKIMLILTRSWSVSLISVLRRHFYRRRKQIIDDFQLLPNFWSYLGSLWAVWSHSRSPQRNRICLILEEQFFCIVCHRFKI